MVFQGYLTDLSYLVRFCVAAVALQVHSIGYPFHSEDVMASPYSLDKPKPQHQGAQVAKADIGIRTALENSLAKFRLSAQTCCATYGIGSVDTLWIKASFVKLVRLSRNCWFGWRRA